jgi:hypothetical protein
MMPTEMTEASAQAAEQVLPSNGTPPNIMATAPAAPAEPKTAFAQFLAKLPAWQRVGYAARNVIAAYGDVDPTATVGAIWGLQKLLGDRVRAYAIPDGYMAIYFEGAQGDRFEKLPSIELAMCAGYIERINPDGTATVLKDRTHYPLPIELPMSTEPVHMTDHLFVDYWAGDSAGRSENCAAMRGGVMSCNAPFEHHPKR